ncbi:MAG: NAD-dependent deacylase [Candidatus Nitrosocosmicus sp.]
MSINSPPNSLNLLKDSLTRSKRIVFLTGSGISKESGVPTFRGKDGLWKLHDSSKLASISAFLKNPTLVWEFYHYRQDLISKCSPNLAHLSISQIQQDKKDTWILTQNVDNLHKRANSNNIIELHGNIFKTNCINCGFSDGELFDIIADILPRCKECKNVLKPGVVLFGEPLPSREWNNAIKVASSCDIMFIVGTSLNVSPANSLPTYAKDNNAVLVEVNPETTWLSKSMDFSLKGSAVDILPKIFNLLR